MLVMQRPTIEAIGEESGNRQRFAVGPLEPGFGHTLGNSLRRTLLSSIPGAAITMVRFDDALHEFDTIPASPRTSPTSSSTSRTSSSRRSRPTR